MSRGGSRPGAGRPRAFAEGAALARTVRLLEERARVEELTLAQLIATLAGPA